VTRRAALLRGSARSVIWAQVGAGGTFAAGGAPSGGAARSVIAARRGGRRSRDTACAPASKRSRRRRSSAFQRRAAVDYGDPTMTERLWAPWRMEYIQQEKRASCIFCDFPSKPAAAWRKDLVLLVQPRAFVCLNRYPFNAGHLLVVPRRHVSSPADLPEDEHDALMRLATAATARVRRATSAQGANVGINLGVAAGAGIADHVHVHVVPRWSGDSNFMPVVGDVRVMPQHLDETYEALAPHFADLPGERAP